MVALAALPAAPVGPGMRHRMMRGHGMGPGAGPQDCPMMGQGMGPGMGNRAMMHGRGVPVTLRALFRNHNAREEPPP